MRNIVKAIQNPKKIISMIKYRIMKFFGNDDYKRIMVLTRSRTGSNYLLSLLNSHPNIYIQGELLDELKGRDYTKVINEIYSKQPLSVKASGFKMFYCHPFPYDELVTKKIMDDFVKMKNLYIIHLKRKNILKTLTSRKIALKQNVWTSRDYKENQSSEQKTINFTREELEKGFEMTRQMEEESDILFKGHQIITIYYEDMVDDPEKEVNRILGMLDIKIQPLKSDLRKQNTEKLPELISNFDDLKESFIDSKWASFFDN